MIIRTPRNPVLSGLGRARRGLGDAPPEPSYQSCESGTLAGVLCEQQNALLRTNWTSRVAQERCDSGGWCDMAADPSGNLTRLTPGGSPVILGWNPSGNDSLVVVNTPVLAKTPAGPGYTAPTPPKAAPPPAPPSATPPTGGTNGGASTSTGSWTDWFSGSMFDSIPNWALVAAGVGALMLFGGGRGR